MGKSGGYCAHTTWLIGMLLGRGVVARGDVQVDEPDIGDLNRLTNHFWLEVDPETVVDVTADQFNSQLGKCALPEIVVASRADLKVYHFGRFYALKDLEWAQVVVGQTRLRSLYRELGTRYNNEEILKASVGMDAVSVVGEKQ